MYVIIEKPIGHPCPWNELMGQTNAESFESCTKKSSTYDIPNMMMWGGGGWEEKISPKYNASKRQKAIGYASYITN